VIGMMLMVLIECYGEGFDIESLEIAFLHGSCDNEKL
jgi:hypothetical protein